MLDSEVKIFEYLGSSLPSDATGTLPLFSELPLCVSCSGVVPQFEKSIPGYPGDCNSWFREVMMDKITLISSLIDAKICTASDIKGATVEDVVALEKTFGKNLPKQYREFLLAVGCGAGDFFRGTDIFLPTLQCLKKEAIDLLAENDENVELGEDAFVFSMHQGYEFTYFNVSEGDAPPCTNMSKAAERLYLHGARSASFWKAQ